MFDMLMIGYDQAKENDIPVLTVGRRTFNGTVDIINAFQGEEAMELYKKLTTKKEVSKNE